MQLAKDELYIYDKDKLGALREFLELTSSEPNRKDILLNEVTETQYIPIDVLEDLFDELTFGQFGTRNFQYSVGNSKVLGSIELFYIHPITGIEITKVGAAACEIQRKILNTADGPKTFDVELALPALLSFCTISAIRKVGRKLGRSLNRDIVNLATTSKDGKPTQLQKALDEIESFSSLKELQDGKGAVVEKYQEQLSLNEMTSLNKVIHDKIVKWVSE